MRAQILEHLPDGSLRVRIVTGETRIVWPQSATTSSRPTILPVHAPSAEQPTIAPNGLVILPAQPEPSLTPGPDTVPVLFRTADVEHRIGFAAGAYSESAGNTTLVVRLHRDVCLTPCTLHLRPGEYRMWAFLQDAPQLGFLQHLEQSIEVGRDPVGYRVEQRRPALAMAGMVGAGFSAFVMLGGTGGTLYGLATHDYAGALPIGGTVLVLGTALFVTSLALFAVYQPRMTLEPARRPLPPPLSFDASPVSNGAAVTATLRF